MTRSTQAAAKRRRRLLALRVAAFIAAIALAVIGIWMIVTGNSTKSVRVGAIASFWALLLGAFAVLGSRVPGRDPDRSTEPVAPVPHHPGPPPPPPRRGEVDLRHVGDIERAAVAAARREFHAQLQEMLHREVSAAVSREMAGLRSEVTALRNELVEKVGGQLHLERIETTRLIGSDLEALQHEVRQLRRTAGLEADPTRAMRITHTLEAPRDTSEDVHDAEIVVERVHPPSEPVQPPVSDPDTVGQPAAAAEPEAEQQPESERQPEATASDEPEQTPEPAADDAPEPSPESATERLPDAATAPTPPQQQESQPQPAPWPAAMPPPDSAAEDQQPDAEPVSEPEPERERRRAAVPEPVAAAARSGAADPFAGLPRLTPFTEFLVEPTSSGTGAGTGDDGDTGDDGGHRHRADDADGDDVLARILARERGR